MNGCCGVIQAYLHVSQAVSDKQEPRPRNNLDLTALEHCQMKTSFKVSFSIENQRLILLCKAKRIYLAIKL